MLGIFFVLLANYAEIILVYSIVGVLLVIYTQYTSFDIAAPYGLVIAFLSIYFVSRNFDNILNSVNPLLLMLAFFILFLIFLNTIKAPDISDSTKTGLRTSLPIIMSFLFSFLYMNKIDVKLFIRVLYLSLIYFLLLPGDIAFLLKWGQWDKFNSFYYGNAPHTFSHFLSILTLFSLHYSVKNKIAYIVLANSFILLFATTIRTSIITAAVFCCTYAICSKNKKTLLITLILFSFILVLPSSRSILTAKFSEFFQTAPADYTDEIGSGRVGIWKRNIRFFANQSILEQLLGSGMHSQHFEYRRGTLRTTIDTHNDYLALLLQIGLFGLIIYCILLLFCIIKAWLKSAELEKRNENMGVYPLLFAFAFGVLISNVFSNSYVNRFQIAIFFWPLMGYLFSNVKKN